MHPIELLNTMKTLLNFDDDDVSRLQTMGSILIPYASDMAQRFYASLEQFEECKQIILEQPDRREKLYHTLISWYTQIYSGNYEQQYAERRWIIGLVHVKLWIPPHFVVGAMENVYLFSANKLKHHQQDLPEDMLLYIQSLSKMLRIDLAFIEQSYAESVNKAMAHEIGANEALLRRVVESGATTLLNEIR
jgi:hypothetical protein